MAALEEAAKQRADAVAELKSEALALRNRASFALAKAAQVDEQVREAEAQALSVQQALSEAQAELDAARFASLAASMPPCLRHGLPRPPSSLLGAPPSHLTAPAVGPPVQAPSVAASAPTLPQRAPDVLSASTAAPPPAQAPLTAPLCSKEAG